MIGAEWTTIRVLVMPNWLVMQSRVHYDSVATEVTRKNVNKPEVGKSSCNLMPHGSSRTLDI